MPIKRILLLLMLFVLTGCSASSPPPVPPTASDDIIVVGFSQVGAESDWRNANTRSMMEALSEQQGYRLMIDDAQQKQQRQITAIRNFIQQGVDYIVLAPTCETGWDTVLGEAKAAGIPVIVVDRMIEVADKSLYDCWVGSDFYAEGQEAVHWMEEHFGEQPLQIVHLQGNLGSSAQLGRTLALQEALDRHPQWQLMSQESGDFTEAKGQELVETLLAAGTPFNVIYAENDNMAYGAINALENAGIQAGQEVTILSFDASRTALQLTLSGKISFDVECNPLHGPRVRSLIVALEKGMVPPKLTFVTETTFDTATITQETIDSRDY